MNVNRLFLAGRLARDPEKRFTNSGMPVVTFSVAVNRKTKAAGDREARDEVTFVEVTGFGKSAEPIAEYLHKGDPIFLEGRLKQESWTDKASGQPRSKLSVVLDSFQFVGAKSEQGADDPRPAPPPMAQQNTMRQGATKQPELPTDSNDSQEVPF